MLLVYGVKPAPRSSVICLNDWVETHWELSLRCQQRLAVSARQVYDLRITGPPFLFVSVSI